MELAAQIGWLLQQGADPNGCDPSGNMPVFLAVHLVDSEQAPQAVHLLMEAGADADSARTHRDSSSLHRAVLLNRQQVVLELIRGGAAPFPSTRALPLAGSLGRFGERHDCSTEIRVCTEVATIRWLRANDTIAIRSLSEHGVRLAKDTTLSILVLHWNYEVPRNPA